MINWSSLTLSKHLRADRVQVALGGSFTNPSAPFRGTNDGGGIARDTRQDAIIPREESGWKETTLIPMKKDPAMGGGDTSNRMMDQIEVDGAPLSHVSTEGLERDQAPDAS